MKIEDMRITFFAFIFLLAFDTFSQSRNAKNENYNRSGLKSLVFSDKIYQVDSIARLDIDSGFVFLILQGGFGTIVYSSDEIFEKKYGIYYIDFGCTFPDRKLSTEYNSVVFEYLTNKYGKLWRKEVRDDVIGL